MPATLLAALLPALLAVTGAVVPAAEPAGAVRVRDAARQALGRAAEKAAGRGLEARVLDLRVPPNAPLPADADAVEAEEPSAVNGGALVIPVTILAPGGSKRRTSVIARVELRGPVAVATRDLRRGERLRPGDLRIETRPIASVDRWLASDEVAAGAIARAALRTGQPVPRSGVGRGAAVEPGQTVQAHVSSGQVALTLETVARGRGDVGSIVAVVGPSQGRLLRARVTAPGEVEILGPAGGRR